MVCPLLKRGAPRCGAVEGDGPRLPAVVLDTFCRGAFERCPALRFFHAAGQPVHPADFSAWVLRGVTPGQVGGATTGFP